MFQPPAIPKGYRPRGSTTTARAAHSKLDCDHAPTARSRPRQKLAAMPVLRRSHQEPGEVQSVVTQEVQKLYDAVRLVLLSQKDAFCELGIIDRFGRFVFRHEELRWITQ
jgi:hypothetical protein